MCVRGRGREGGRESDPRCQTHKIWSTLRQTNTHAGMYTHIHIRKKRESLTRGLTRQGGDRSICGWQKVNCQVHIQQLNRLAGPCLTLHLHNLELHEIPRFFARHENGVPLADGRDTSQGMVKSVSITRRFTTYQLSLQWTGGSQGGHASTYNSSRSKVCRRSTASKLSICTRSIFPRGSFTFSTSTWSK